MLLEGDHILTGLTKVYKVQTSTEQYTKVQFIKGLLRQLTDLTLRFWNNSHSVGSCRVPMLQSCSPILTSAIADSLQELHVHVHRYLLSTSSSHMPLNYNFLAST